MSGAGRESRNAQARAILAEFGLVAAGVETAGHNGEIAVLTVPAAIREQLLDERRTLVAERLKALGFHYVALDLGPAA